MEGMDVGVGQEAVVQAFTTLGEQIASTVGAVALVAVGIAAIILGFKYGRKILNTVAK